MSNKLDISVLELFNSYRYFQAGWWFCLGLDSHEDKGKVGKNLQGKFNEPSPEEKSILKCI